MRGLVIRPVLKRDKAAKKDKQKRIWPRGHISYSNKIWNLPPRVSYLMCKQEKMEGMPK